MNRIRFQADADLNQIIVRAVIRREPSVDFQLPDFLGIRDMTDAELLAHCAKQDRILVSHDLRTMPEYFGAFVAEARSPGLVIVPQKVPYSVAAEEILMIWGASSAEEWINRIVVLPL